MIYTVTTNPCIDYYMEFSQQPQPGAINRARFEEAFAGGKGINVSLLLSRLGGETCALGFCAGAGGKMLCELLQEQNCPHDFIELPEGMTRINVKLRCEPETAFNGCGPAVDAGSVGALVAKLGQLTAGDTLVLSGNLHASMRTGYAELAAIAQKNGARLVVDTTGDALLSTLRYRPYFVKPNLDELGDLFGCRIKDRAEAFFFAQQLRSRGAQNVLVSMGADGALLLTADQRRYHAICTAKGKVRSTVGAGDSLVAGFLAAGEDAPQALAFGVAAGTATAFTGRIADAELVRTLAQQVELTEL